MSSSTSPIAAWFDTPEHADVLVNVWPDLQTRVKRARTVARRQRSAAAAAAAAAARSFHCHAVILAAYSDYFKAQLSSAWQQAEQPETARGSSSAGNKRTDKKTVKHIAAPSKRIVSVHVEAEAVDAMQELLRMMYSQELPQAAAPFEPLFLHCLRLADRFQAASCMELLLTALAAVPSKDIGCTMLRYAFQASPGVVATPSYPALLASSITALVRLFGDVPKVIMNKDLLQQFCALPHAAVLAWVQSDELRVDSENCVVFLLSAWVKVNQDSTAAQHEELAHQIRVFHLGPAYLHHILPHLSWFKGCSGMQHLPVVLSCISAGITMKQGLEREEKTFFNLTCPSAWTAKPRGSSPTSPRTGIWVMSSSQLKEMGSGVRQYLSPPVYVNSFLFEINVDQIATGPSAATPGKTLGMYRGISRASMQQRGLAVPDNVMVPMRPVNVRVGSPESWEREEGYLGACCVVGGDHFWGEKSFLGSSAPTLLQLLAPYLLEGQLQVKATFSGVDVAL